MKTTRPILLGALLVGCSGGDDSIDQLESAADATPQQVDGNPSCDELLDLFGVKIDPPTPGTYAVGGGSVTLTTNGTVASWTSTVGIDAVIVKGGPAANLYEYDPPAESFGDTDLVSPNNSSGKPAAISHIEFCFDYELSVSKTASPSFTRSYTWEIDKTAAESALLLAPGQTFLMSYQVVTSVSGSSDTDHALSGTVTIDNPAPVAATITSISDFFDGSPVALDCGVALPHVLAAGETLACSYAVDLGGPTNGTNQVSVETSGPVGGGGATAAVDFGAATISEIDDCIDVSDDRAGPLGQTCASESPKTYAYTLAVGPYSAPEGCGAQEFDNTASFTTNDTGATGAATAVVGIEVPCETGCTLTQGYWKTHSAYGPAPADDNWLDLLPSGPDSPFFLGGATYHQILWTAPRGNAYYSLAHQYIAAELNNLNGATFTDAQAAFDDATALFATYTPAAIGALKSGPLRASFLALASALDAYNNGVTGPGHCSE